MIDKNQKSLNPLNAPELYNRHYSKHQNDIVITDRNTGHMTRYELLSQTADPKTGFQSSVMIDRATGHAVILYKGMDTPLKDEGNGRLGFLRDAFTAAQSLLGFKATAQTPLAEKTYLDTINHPDVKTVEAVGFSLGTLHVNYMAAKHGAVGTVLSDLGIADNTLTKLFNQKSGADQDPNTLLNRLKQNITVLSMGLDLIPHLFGASPSRGHVINLDEGSKPDLSGVKHSTRVYSEKADKHAAQTMAAPMAAPAPMPA